MTQRGESFTEINRFDELLEALTLEQVAAAAQRYFTGDRYVRVVLLPEDGLASKAAVVPDAVLAVLRPR